MAMAKPSASNSHHGRIYACRQCHYFHDLRSMKGHVVARHLELEEAPFFCRVCHLKFLEGADWAKHANSSSHRVRVMVCPSALGQNALGRSGWEFITEGPDWHADRWGAQESKKYFDLTRSVRPQASGYTLKSLLSEVPLTTPPEEEAEPESAEEDEENSYEPLILHVEEWSRHNGEDTTGAGRQVTETEPMEDKAESALEPSKDVAAPTPDGSVPQTVLSEDKAEFAPEPDKVVAPDESGPQTVLLEDEHEATPEPAKVVAPDESSPQTVLSEDKAESAPEPAKVVAPYESGPQTVLLEDKAESAPEPAKVVALDESGPQTVLSEDKAESAPEPAKVVAPYESGPQTVLLEDKAESAPEPAKVVALDESGPQTVLSEDKAESAPEPAKVVAPDESGPQTVPSEDKAEFAPEPDKVVAPDESGPQTVLSEDKAEFARSQTRWWPRTRAARRQSSWRTNMKLPRSQPRWWPRTRAARRQSSRRTRRNLPRSWPRWWPRTRAARRQSSRRTRLNLPRSQPRRWLLRPRTRATQRQSSWRMNMKLPRSQPRWWPRTKVARRQSSRRTSRNLRATRRQSCWRTQCSPRRLPPLWAHTALPQSQPLLLSTQQGLLLHGGLSPSGTGVSPPLPACRREAARTVMSLTWCRPNRPRNSLWKSTRQGSLSWICLERFSPPLPLPRWPPSPVNRNAPWWCKSCPCGHTRSIKSQKTAPSPLKERLTGQYPWSTCRGAAKSSPRLSPRPWSRLSSGLFRKKKRRTSSSPCWRT